MSPSNFSSKPSASNLFLGIVAQDMKPYIGEIEEAPEYHRFNPHIKHGYRINYQTWSATLLSIFQCHNETINVWSHFIGFLISLVALLVVFCNYGNESTGLAQLSQLKRNGLEGRVHLSEIEGFDMGLLHSQLAEFRIFHMTVQRYVSKLFVAVEET